MSFYRTTSRKIIPLIIKLKQLKHKNIKRKVVFKKVSPDMIQKKLFSNYKKAFFAILQIEKKASLTVEASLAVPFFLFVACNLMYVANFFYKDADRITRMTENSKNYAIYMYAVRNNVDDDTASGMGFQSDSDCTFSDDNIDLYEFSTESPMFVPFGFMDYMTVNRATCHMWTGYQVTEGKEEEEAKEYVYVTTTGTAYHTYRDCSYISITIHSVSSASISTQTNAEGSYYRECERCKNMTDTGCYYITNTGDAYHKSVSCGAIKRTVWVVTIEEAKEDGRTLCTRCQGR